MKIQNRGRTSGTVTVKIENVFKNLQPSMCQQPIFVAIFCCCLCPWWSSICWCKSVHFE